ncbi:MAG: hypothetical protein Q8K02_05035, partial [Flavobacterium sp.]|nr:hypothetical protein [Flavobacterium sp.]
GIGQEKVLVVLAIRESKIDFTHPIRIQDMTPVIVKSREKWTGEDISKELEVAKMRLGKIKYAVTDGCCTLKKGLKLAGVPHIYDVTHAIAIYLERIYRDDNKFKYFMSQSGLMRSKLCNHRFAYLIPPNQRSKSRFLNLDIISKWAVKALRAFNKNEISVEESETLEWVKEYDSFIIEISELISIIEEISVLLKNNGLNKKTKSQCYTILKRCKHGKLKEFKVHFTDYLKVNGEHLNRKTKNLLCCSDIIESTFGKYKNELSKNSMSGITDLVLIIPALTAELNAEKVIEAIDSCTVEQIEKWKKENLCNTLISRRNKVFSY